MHPVQTVMSDKDLVKASTIAEMRNTPVQVDMEFDPERYNNFFKERLTDGVTTYEGDWIIENVPERQRNIDEMNLVYKEYESKCPLRVTPDLMEKKNETAPLSGSSFLGGTSNDLLEADPNVMSRFILQSVPKSKGSGYHNMVSKLD